MSPNRGGRAASSRSRSPRKKPHLRNMLLTFLGATVLILGMLSYAFGYYALSSYVGEWTQIRPLKITLAAPKFLVINENQEFHVAAENNRGTPTETRLRLNGGGFIGDETNSIFNGIIQSKEQIQITVPVYFPYESVLIVPGGFNGRLAGLVLWASVDNKEYIKVADLPIRISPIAYTMTLFNGTISLLTISVGFATKELWDLHKQFQQQ